VQAHKHLDGLDDDAIHASATISPDRLLAIQVLNTTKKPVNYKLQIGAQYAEVVIAPNALQTIRVQL
jgi:glucosylceramidase